ncbi:MAG: hypothetical protein EOP84_21545 [Verrucomicrobiaceae bacterium]|nr:MAG: hypothetical protein EOP84_21545 [Verrucomicrobiaceae bacterium]
MSAGSAAILLGSCAPRGISPGTKADYILIEKSERKLTLQKSGIALKSYRVALGHQPVGKKEFEGDFKTPEGIYQIVQRRPEQRPTAFHRGLLLSYPNPQDRAYARKHGQSPGEEVLIHGVKDGFASKLGRAHLLIGDWTQGCIAVSNPEIEEIYESVPLGTKVEIRP